MRRATLVTLACFVTVAAAAGTRTIELRKCGVAFAIPASWSTQLRSAEQIDDSVQCSIALRPRGWSQRARRSRWGASDPPLSLVVFKPETSYDEALDQMGFESDEAYGHGFGVPGGYGTFATAEPYKAGDLTGQAAYSYFRGFIKDEKLLEKDESRVFSGDIGHIVLKAPSGRVVAFQCEGSTPDERVNCEPVIQMIGRSIVLRAPR
jgi:hypothetical protein